MNKLTAEMCCELLDKLNSNGMSILEGYYAEALEIALPILEQQEQKESVTLREGLTALSTHIDSIGGYNFEALEAYRGEEFEQQERGCKSCGGNKHVAIDHGELGIEHMVCDKCKVKPEQQERGEVDWIEWKGGECPVYGDQIVRVKFKSGEEHTWRAKNYYWKRTHDETDIIAYRIIPEQSTNQNGEQ